MILLIKCKTSIIFQQKWGCFSLGQNFFYFLVLGKFLGKPSVGGGNKNKNKIQKIPRVGIKIKIKVTKLSIFFIFFSGPV